MGIGAAIGGIAGGLLSRKSAKESAKAATKAADAQVEANRESIEFQKDALEQARYDSYPYMVVGASALQQLGNELGISMPTELLLPSSVYGERGYGQQIQPQNALVSQPVAPQVPPPPQNALLSGGSGYVNESEGMDAPADYFTRTVPAPVAQPQVAAQPQPAQYSPIGMTQARGFTETPGYQFRVQEGEKGVLNNLAALGMKNSGSALKALEKYRQGVASQEYGNYLNRLSSLAGVGQTQTSQINSLGVGTGRSIGQSAANAGTARASGYVGAANALSQGYNGMAQGIGQALGSINFNQLAKPTYSSPYGLY